VHAAVDTLGDLLALHVSSADEQDREQVGELARAVQEATGESVKLAYVDQGYTRERAATEAEAHGMSLEVVKSILSRSGALCYCHADGLWSETSHGHRGSGG
jgi:hypothetical protein